MKTYLYMDESEIKIEIECCWTSSMTEFLGKLGKHYFFGNEILIMNNELYESHDSLFNLCLNSCLKSARPCQFGNKVLKFEAIISFYQKCQLKKKMYASSKMRLLSTVCYLQLKISQTLL